MRNRYWTLLLWVLAAALPARAQTVFAPPGAEWTYNYQLFAERGVYQYTLEADTVIQGHVFRHLRGRIWGQNASSPGSPTQVRVMDSQYVYATGDQVYWWRGGQFVKLYDFAAPVGATWRLPDACSIGLNPPTQFFRVRVDSVGTLQVSGQSLRWFQVSVDSGTIPSYMLTIDRRRVVERVGSLQWMLPTSDCSTDPVTGADLLCYHDSSGFQYGIANCLSMVLKVNEAASRRPVSLAPTSSDDGHYRLRDLTAATAYTVWDGLGRSRRQGFVSPDDAQLNLIELAPGLYVLRLATGQSLRLVRN